MRITYHSHRKKKQQTRPDRGSEDPDKAAECHVVRFGPIVMKFKKQEVMAYTLGALILEILP